MPIYDEGPRRAGACSPIKVAGHSLNLLVISLHLPVDPLDPNRARAAAYTALLSRRFQENGKTKNVPSRLAQVPS